ncbi:MAG: helix-turn-helix transcriptional regulator [Firmicutes bacterium]|nr:helix-turn-helix transcriptional regulator [Bacillota bacterium]
MKNDYTKDNYAEGMKQKVGMRLRELRQEQHLKQEELAQRAQCHPTYIAKIESGERIPSLDVLKRLADALEVPATSIIGVIDEIEGVPSKSRLIDEVTLLLYDCSPQRIYLVRDFIRLIKHYFPEKTQS